MLASQFAPHSIAPTPAASVPVKHSAAVQLMPDLMNVVKKSSSSSNNKRSATMDAAASKSSSPSKRKKETPVHPRLPAVQSTEMEEVIEIKLEGAVSKIKRLGLPVDRDAIEKAVTESDEAFNRYLGLLQAKRAAALVQQKQKQTVQLPPSPTSTSSKEATAFGLPPTPTTPLPRRNYVLAVDSNGRAAVRPVRSPSPPSTSGPGAFSRRFVPRTQVVAAEIDGMGRVVLERSVLVDRLGQNGAAVAEARARGSVAPPMMTQTITPPPSSTGNLPFGFGVKLSGESSTRLPLLSIGQDKESAAQRNERIAAWLNAPEEDDEQEAEELAPKPIAPTASIEAVAEQEQVVPPVVAGLGKSTVRLSNVSHRFQPSAAEVAQSSPVKQAAVEWHEAPKEDVAEDGVVDCLCHRGDEEGEDLVQCERCRSWYHLACVDLELAELPEHWMCVRCTGGEMPAAWRTRQPSLHGTPLREPPTLVESAITPRIGHFTNSFLSSELALAPSPVVGRTDGKRVRIMSAEYSPRSPSRGSINYGARRRLQSGTFDDPLPIFDEEEMHHRAMPAWPEQTEYAVDAPLPAGPGHLFPSTPSRYAYNVLTESRQETPASTVDSAHSRSSSAAGTRFSFPATPSSQELLAHFDSASSAHRYQYLPSFSPVCEQSPLLQRHRRNRSSISGGPYTFVKANWATGPPSSSAGLIKAMMSGPPSSEAAAAAATGMTRSESGLGIGFEAGAELAQAMDF